jgi:stage V sporulation protein SpoVS
LAIWASPGLAVLEWQRAEVHAVGKQQVEGHVRRAVISEQEFVEERAAGVVEDHQLTIEHIALRQQTEHFLEALHAVAVARDQLATDGVGCGAEAVELGLEEPVGVVEGFRAPERIDQR